MYYLTKFPSAKNVKYGLLYSNVWFFNFSQIRGQEISKKHQRAISSIIPSVQTTHVSSDVASFPEVTDAAEAS